MSKELRKSFYAFGTINNISVTADNVEEVMEKIASRIYDINSKMSYYDENSEVSKINKNAGLDFVSASDDTLKIIVKALKYSRLTKGAFDITARKALNLWGVERNIEYLPSEGEAQEVLDLVNYKDIIVDKNKKKIMLKRKGQEIDFGAIAKGYVADKIKDILVESKAESAILDLGGQVMTYGNERTWTIGIQDPNGDRNKPIGTVETNATNIVTSGSYERYNRKEGKKIHHIINAKTGEPTDNSIVSATVLYKKGVDADAISTCLFVLGIDRAKEFLGNLNGVEAIIIDENKNIFATEEIKKNFKLISTEYKLI